MIDRQKDRFKKRKIYRLKGTNRKLLDMQIDKQNDRNINIQIFMKIDIDKLDR